MRNILCKSKPLYWIYLDPLPCWLKQTDFGEYQYMEWNAKDMYLQLTLTMYVL
jgi:hypothetical protein